MRKDLYSDRILVELAPGNVAMFRFLLEAYENLALFTVLERNTALLKVFFAPQSSEEVIRMLEDINRSVPLTWRNWPL